MWKLFYRPGLLVVWAGVRHFARAGKLVFGKRAALPTGGAFSYKGASGFVVRFGTNLLTLDVTLY